VDGRCGIHPRLAFLPSALFGLAPAWQMIRISHFRALKETSAQRPGTAKARLPADPGGSQVALALVLLVSAPLPAEDLRTENDCAVDPVYDTRTGMVAVGCTCRFGTL